MYVFVRYTLQTLLVCITHKYSGENLKEKIWYPNDRFLAARSVKHLDIFQKLPIRGSIFSYFFLIFPPQLIIRL